MAERYLRILHVEAFGKWQGLKLRPPYEVVQHDTRREMSRRMRFKKIPREEDRSGADVQTDGKEEE